MGDDFLQKTNKSFTKGCDRERQKLTLAEFGLFGTAKEMRTILCEPYNLDHFRDKDAIYELSIERACGDSASGVRIFIYADGADIGVCNNVPQSVLHELSALGGKTLGKVLKVREHSGLVDIIVALDSQSKAGEAA